MIIIHCGHDIRDGGSSSPRQLHGELIAPSVNKHIFSISYPCIGIGIPVRNNNYDGR